MISSELANRIATEAKVIPSHIDETLERFIRTAASKGKFTTQVVISAVSEETMGVILSTLRGFGYLVDKVENGSETLGGPEYCLQISWQ